MFLDRYDIYLLACNLWGASIYLALGFPSVISLRSGRHGAEQAYVHYLQESLLVMYDFNTLIGKKTKIHSQFKWSCSFNAMYSSQNLQSRLIIYIVSLSLQQLFRSIILKWALNIQSSFWLNIPSLIVVLCTKWFVKKRKHHNVQKVIFYYR